MKRTVKSMLALAAQGERTKSVLRRWSERAWADSSTMEDRDIAAVLAAIAELDARITEALSAHQ